MKSPKKNVAESVRARLLTLSKKRGDEFHLTLADYAIERFLYRLGQSPLRDKFVLKGAVLFRVWMGQSHRPTKDLDLLGRGSSELSEVADAIREVCLIDAADGVVFDLDGLKAERIREGAEYEGVRIRLRAELAAAQIPLQIDVGFGDAITPMPSLTAVPSVLGMDPPQVLAYPRETVVAEKLHAMVILDISNTRMKDFYDLWFLSRSWPFQLIALADAIRATFERRGTPLPVGTPFALTPEFHSDPQKSLQWKAFVKRLRLDSSTPALDEIAEAIRRFIEVPFREARTRTAVEETWSVPRSWSRPSSKLD
jgi:predicted nucleotidyltransferase component of viral defense system